MADFNQQLENIARLRAATRGHEEALYGARIRLRRADQQLARAQRSETVVPEERGREISRLRAQMARLNATLATLRGEEQALAAELEQIRGQQQTLDDLKTRLAAATARRQALTDRLAQLRQSVPPANQQIASVQVEIEKLRNAIAELERAIRDASEQIAHSRQREESLRAQLAALRERMAGLRADLAGLQQRIAELQQPVFIDRETIDASIAGLKADAERNRQLAGRTGIDLSRAIGEIYREDPHPRTALARLSDQCPFLLFPLRLETIFEGNELRVRVFPDEIVVHTHEATLTDREIDAGQLYWVELLVAAHLRTLRDARRADAWRHVVDLFGGQRGAWVARNTRPADWQTLANAAEGQSLIAFLDAADATLIPGLLALPLTPALHAELVKAIADDDGDAFFEVATRESWSEALNDAVRQQIAGFPVPDLTRTDAWSRAPRTRVLPDRFVLLLYPTETSAPQEIPGALIADTVFLGPDPLDPGAGLVKNGVVRTFEGDCKWLADFDTAVTQGLAFKVPLSEQQVAQGFARVVVLGLRLSAGATQSAGMLEELIANHQYSPKGFSLVAQGTPTNNTESDGSGYSDNDPYDDQRFYTAIDPPAFDPNATDARVSQTDGRLLADALGISYSSLQAIPSAEQIDVLEARAMNSALFPATLGYWLKTWMAPVITPTAARLTRAFFTQHVTGRGPLPAIRVGNQPYGVLVTSDMTRWKYPTPDSRFETIALFDEQTPYRRKLHELLSQLQTRWQEKVKDVARVGGGTDAADLLMKILGLHPTSVEFFQRIGFHQLFLDDLKNFVDPHGRYAGEFYSLIHDLPATALIYLQGLDVETTTADIGKTTAFNVLWQHYVSRLDVPNLVESKPPSETSGLTNNYVDWLLAADSTNKIIQETFPGEAPSALLYLMLRNALLLQLHAGVYQWIKDNANYTPALERSAQTGLLMPNVSGSAPSVSRFELMNVKVDTVIAAHPSPGTSVADWIRNGPPAAETEAAFAQEQRAALEVLSSATTAGLERCLVEHLDCCQYRLDAWETGLFAQRLSEQRGTGALQERRTGVYLGAFGWVENLKQTPRARLGPESLPAALRPAPEDTGPILEEDEVPAPTPKTKRIANAEPIGSRRGGFTHAPSINHAAAAALLRNAYLSHSDSDQADVLSNNLSSDRVRRAEFVLEGMRNGQPIEAVLGYQFERALHDRTSLSERLKESPVLELNEFIQPYREAFPFEAREIPQAGTGPATETLPPYSVVNGLTLISAPLTAGNGFGLSAVLNAAELPGAVQGNAIVAARDALRETLDAVKDLLMAENAYQLVLGNFDRVAAVSLAQKDARIPPTLQVQNTPRGSQFTFSNRVTLHFDDLDPSLESSRPWPGALTPRALAEPGINFWLGTVLGRSPEKVSCKVWWVLESAEDAVPQDERFVTLADLHIQPVDFVTLASINAGDQRGATQLEQRIARRYREMTNAAPDAIVRIHFDPNDAPDELTIGQILPLARRLRALLGECRALNAQDFLPSAGGKATTIAVDKSNPDGVDAAELRARVAGIAASLTALAGRLDGPAAASVTLKLLHNADDAGDDETFTGRLGDAYLALDAARVDFTDNAQVDVTFALLDAQQLQTTLQAVAAYGIADAFSPEIDLTDDLAKRALLARARRVAKRLRSTNPAEGVLDRANALLGAVPADKPARDQVTALLQAAQILFGDSFRCLPQFTCHNEADLSAANGARTQLLSFALGEAPDLDAAGLIDEWLQGLARVRPRMNTWETVRMLTDALNDVSVEMLPVQVPFRSKDSWLAVKFPAQDPLDATKSFGITRDTLSITAHGAAAFKPGAQRGLLLDEWTEEIPTASENTGISFRFNQPNAVPPQSLLLAITPEQTGSWSWDSLVGILNDTLARAKRRAVEPLQLEKEGSIWNQLAPATVSEFSMVAPADVSLDYLRMVESAQLNNLYSAFSKS